MPDAEEIGWIILKTSRIERLLRENGACGNGLRELADSLGDELAPEMHELLRYIGAVRNMAAHEGEEAELESWSPEFFAEACDAVIEELTGEGQEREAPSRNGSAAADHNPPLKLKYLAFIPGLHVFYPLELLFRAFYGTYFIMCGLTCTFAAVYLAFVTVKYRLYGIAPAALLLGAAGYIAALLFAEKRGYRYIPLLNNAVLARELISGVDYPGLFIALTLLTVPFIGVYLIISHGELAAGVSVLALGYIAGAIAATLHRS